MGSGSGVRWTVHKTKFNSVDYWLYCGKVTFLHLWNRVNMVRVRFLRRLKVLEVTLPTPEQGRAAKKMCLFSQWTVGQSGIWLFFTTLTVLRNGISSMLLSLFTAREMSSLCCTLLYEVFIEYRIGFKSLKSNIYSLYC